MTRPERGVDRIPDVVEAARTIELVRIDVERDARTGMTELAGRPDRVDASPDQVARERMAQVMEPELRHVISLQAGCTGRAVKAALRDIVPIERLPATRFVAVGDASVRLESTAPAMNPV